jgi:N-carbamoylputrescine amidase
MAGIYHNSALHHRHGWFRSWFIQKNTHQMTRILRKILLYTWNLGFKTIPTKKRKVGTLICWDQWYQEAARLTALQGAGFLFYLQLWDGTQVKKNSTEQISTVLGQ